MSIIEQSPPADHVGGVEITVGNLSYCIKLAGSNNWKKILNDVSIQLKPGSLTALMGPSGSGKR